VDVGRREHHCERGAAPVDHKVALRTRFALICRVRPGFLARPFTVMLAESSEARETIPVRTAWSSMRGLPSLGFGRFGRQQRFDNFPQLVRYEFFSHGEEPTIRSHPMVLSSCLSPLPDRSRYGTVGTTHKRELGVWTGPGSRRV
jgi:hypothetical protein